MIHLTHTYIGSISVEAVEGFLKRHHIWTCHTDLWRMWRAFLIHLTHTDRGTISVEAVEGFLNRHHIWIINRYRSVEDVEGFFDTPNTYRQK